MKQQIDPATLWLVQHEARERGLRMGQHLVNTHWPESGEESARLFYAPDSEFWDIVFDYFELT